MEQTIVYSVVQKAPACGEEQLTQKLLAMPGVQQATASAKEGRVTVQGKNLNPLVFEQAIEQSGYQVLFTNG